MTAIEPTSPVYKFAAIAICGAIFRLLSPNADAQDRPNFVVILCDDLGYGDLECYGHPHIKTPHLNQLAAEGVRFTDFYSAAPVCSPSRVGLLTGRSPNRAGVYDWIPPRSEVHLRADESALPQLLQSSGYATCLSGKWHCNGQFNTNTQPQPDDAGFDHWFATQNNASPSHENPVNFVRNGEKVGPLEGYSCQLVVDEALDWLAGHRDAEPEQPFFLYVAFHEPHEPVASPKSLVTQYADVAENEDQAQYFANVTNLDAAVGRLMAGLRNEGIEENTLVVFTSDNGPETLRRYRGAGRSWGTPGPLRGMKLWTTDAGFRVAGIMRWPGRIVSGTVSRQAVSSLDFLPTFLHLANAERPADLRLDGVNFLPALHGEPIERERPLLWIYYNAINERRVAMRHGQWKALAKLNIGKLKTITTANADAAKSATLSDFQLFDITQDIHEENDVSTSVSSETLNRLKATMNAGYQDLLNGSHIWNAHE